MADWGYRGEPLGLIVNILKGAFLDYETEQIHQKIFGDSSVGYDEFIWMYDRCFSTNRKHSSNIQCNFATNDTESSKTEDNDEKSTNTKYSG